MKQKRSIAKNQYWLSLLLLVGCLGSLVVASSHVRTRWDLTAHGEYSLAPVTASLLGKLEDRLQIKLYFNRDLEGAESLLPLRVVLEDLLDEVQVEGGGLVSLETVDPTQDFATGTEAERLGISAIQVPMQNSGGNRMLNIWQGLEMRYQGRTEVIPFLVPSEFEFAFASRLGNLMREERPTIGIFSREPAAGPQIPGVPVPVPEGREFEELRQTLGQRYSVRDLQPLAENAWEGLAAVIVGRPQNVTVEELATLRQYLADGGRVVVLYDHHLTDLQTMARSPIETGLDAWLGELGVVVNRELIWSDQGFPFSITPQTVEMPDGRLAQVPRSANYGLWPILTEESIANGPAVVAALNNLLFPWAHPVRLHQVPNRLSAEVLLETSATARLLPSDVPVGPTLENLEKLRAQALQGGPQQTAPLAVSLTGPFAVEGPAGQLVVVGDADVFANFVYDVLPSAGNRDLAANLFDWVCQDELLINLRTRGSGPQRIRNFFQESVEDQGGIRQGLARDELEAIDAVARSHDRTMRRAIAWANVLGPLLILGLLAFLHRAFHGARARKGWGAVA